MPLCRKPQNRPLPSQSQYGFHVFYHFYWLYSCFCFGVVHTVDSVSWIMFPFCVAFRNCLVLRPSLTFRPNSRCMKKCILFGGWKHVKTRTVNISTSPKLVEGKACWKNSRTPNQFWGKPMVSTDQCIEIILVFIRCYKAYCGGLFWSCVAYFIIFPLLKQAAQMVGKRHKRATRWADQQQSKLGTVRRLVGLQRARNAVAV